MSEFAKADLDCDRPATAGFPFRQETTSAGRAVKSAMMGSILLYAALGAMPLAALGMLTEIPGAEQADFADAIEYRLDATIYASLLGLAADNFSPGSRRPVMGSIEGGKT
ncbi:hypothetical protein [Sphingopyxis sp. MSC1_008]|jgi:hypothetical protein|uniref:hypothetical protein n=1 Tax=Sphingopyxis sp. MSC1_008 TaxID=2909265 RepID=UPI0020BF36F7|nr:hypothetical protein [Sphingopyxis sp. MSC1_008]